MLGDLSMRYCAADAIYYVFPENPHITLAPGINSS
jgi:hypothetical protein